MPITTVLVSLDGSGLAEAAIAVAARIARLAGARMRLVLVHEAAPVMVPVPEYPMLSGPDDSVLRADQEKYLAAVAHGLGTIGDAPVEFEIVAGRAGPALVEYLGRTRPGLMVMATHGRGPLTRFWLGSVADHVLREGDTPLLLVRPAGDDPPAAPSRFSKGLLPVDRSGGSDELIEPALVLAELTEAHLTLLTVVQPVYGFAVGAPPYPTVGDPRTQQLLEDDARTHLDGLAERLRARGFTVDVRVVVGAGVASMILEVAAEVGADFIGLGTHSTAGLRRAILGSVADKVVRGAVCPVLVTRRHGPAPDGTQPADQPGH